MKRKILIRDLTLRDGQQSQFATRMTQAQIDRVLPLYKKANFYAMEVWGGAIPDSVMRFLNENPWDRLEKIKKEIGGVSKLTALSRGRNLFGYNPYPDEVIEGFCRNSIQSGLDIMRIFDALNDLENMKSTIKYVKKYGGTADCAVCFTSDPKFSFKDKMKAKFTGKEMPGKIFTNDYFIKKAKELENMGADMITIKDMAGLITPHIAGPIIKGIKKRVNIPVDLHTHCTPGYGVGTLLVGMVNGVDIVDTVIMPFAGGPAGPSFEIIQIFADKLGLDTGVNLEAVVEIGKHLKDIRRELAPFDELKRFPKDFNILTDNLPAEIDEMFDKAIQAAKEERYDDVVTLTQAIEKYFNFPAPDEAVKEAQIPGGMYTNMMSQLKQAKLDQLFGRVLEIVPKVRLDAGLPPLVTPTSQIVGVQAVSCIVDETKGLPHYTTKTNQYVNLVKGSYGKTPFPVNPDFRQEMAGVREETPYDVSSYKKQDNPVLPELGGVKLAENEKEELLLELFPAVAGGFLKKRKEKAYLETKLDEQRQQEEAREKEREAFKQLPKEKKEEILRKGLYGSW